MQLAELLILFIFIFTSTYIFFFACANENSSFFCLHCFIQFYLCKLRKIIT